MRGFGGSNQKQNEMRIKRVIRFNGAEIVETTPGVFVALPYTPRSFRSKTFNSLEKAKNYIRLCLRD